MKYIASCSFGKDSIAQIILAYENKEPLDIVLYCEVMFDNENNISGELPEHREFIYNIAIPRIKKEFGYKVVVVKSEKDFVKEFHTTIKKGKNKGKIRAFPIGWKCQINRDCKVTPIHRYYKQLKEPITTYIGIAKDEPKRLERLKANEISLLDKYNFTEAMAYELCKKYNLLSPIYNISKRNGCWFCPNQRKCEIKHLYEKHPELFNKLVSMHSTPNKASEHWNRSQTIIQIQENLKRGKNNAESN